MPSKPTFSVAAKLKMSKRHAQLGLFSIYKKVNIIQMKNFIRVNKSLK
jgi:hypothetical protein